MDFFPEGSPSWTLRESSLSEFDLPQDILDDRPLVATVGTYAHIDVRDVATLDIVKSIPLPSEAHSSKHFNVQRLEEGLVAVNSNSYPFSIHIVGLEESCVLRTCRGHDMPIFHMCPVSFYDRWSTFASVSRDRTLRIWNADDCSQLLVFPHPCALYAVTEVKWMNSIASGGHSHEETGAPCVYIHDLESRTLVSSLSGHIGGLVRGGHTSLVRSLETNDEIQCLFSGGSDRSLMMWDARSATALSCVGQTLCTNGVYCVRCVADRHLVLGQLNRGKIYVWDDRRLTLPLVQFAPHSDYSTGCDMRRVGRDAFVSVHGSGLAGVALWDVRGKILRSKSKLYFPPQELFLMQEQQQQQQHVERQFLGQTNALSVCALKPPKISVLGAVLPMKPNEEEKRRLEFLFSDICMENLFDFRLKINDAVVRCPKAFLHSSKIPNLESLDEWEVFTPGPVDPVVFVKLLIGVHSKIPPRHVLAYVLAFLALGLMKHAYLVCVHMSTIQNLESIVETFALSKMRSGGVRESDEMDVEDEGEAESPEIVACCNILKARHTELSPELLARCESLGLKKAVLIAEDVRPLWELPIFGLQDVEDRPSSFAELGKQLLGSLFVSGAFTDVCLKTSDGSLVRTHLPILIWKLNFAHMIFEGEEAESVFRDREISVPFLPKPAVLALVEFSFVDQVLTDDLGVLIPLYQHSHTYHETKLRELLKWKIDMSVESLLGAAQFESAIHGVALFLRDHACFGEFMSSWVGRGIISQEKLDKEIHRAYVRWEMDSGFVSLQRQMTDSAMKIESMDQRLTHLETGFRRVEEMVSGIYHHIVRRDPREDQVAPSIDAVAPSVEDSTIGWENPQTSSLVSYTQPGPQHPEYQAPEVYGEQRDVYDGTVVGEDHQVYDEASGLQPDPYADPEFLGNDQGVSVYGGADVYGEPDTGENFGEVTNADAGEGGFAYEVPFESQQQHQQGV